MNRPTCLARLALRGLVTWENAIIVGMVLGTAASVGMTALAAALTFRLL